MTKKKNDVMDTINAWSAGINKVFEDKRKQDKLLHPSRPQIKRLQEYATYLSTHTGNAHFLSQLGHGSSLETEKLQSLIDFQMDTVEEIVKDIQDLLNHIKETKEEGNEN